MLAGLREKIQKSPAVGGAVAGGVLVLAAVIFLTSGGDPDVRPTIETAYYYDLDAKTLFTNKPDLNAPIKAPSGGQGVLAYVFGCGSCEEDKRFIGYLKRYTDEAKEALEETIRKKSGDPSYQVPGETAQMIEDGLVVRSPDQEEWTMLRGKAGKEIILAPMRKPPCSGGEKPVSCTPPQQ